MGGEEGKKGCHNTETHSVRDEAGGGRWRGGQFGNMYKYFITLGKTKIGRDEEGRKAVRKNRQTAVVSRTGGRMGSLARSQRWEHLRTGRSCGRGRGF